MVNLYTPSFFRTLKIHRHIHPRWSMGTAHRVLWGPSLLSADTKVRVCTLIFRSRDWVFETLRSSGRDTGTRPTWRTLDSLFAFICIPLSFSSHCLAWAFSKHQRLFTEPSSISLFIGLETRNSDEWTRTQTLFIHG